MYIRILKRARAHVVQALCVLSGILFGIQICYCDAALSNYYRHENTRVTSVYDQTVRVSRIECCTKCHLDSSCNSVNYNPGSRECQLSTITDFHSESEISGEWVTYSTNKPSCKTKNYLVSGPNGVNDSQLTESGYLCKNYSCNLPDGFSAKYARLNMRGHATGGWHPFPPNAGEYIQVDFLGARIISAIALQPHAYGTAYVTSFKVNTSMDCVMFFAISDETGNAKIFIGNSNTEAFVIRDLPEGVRARCVRINPVDFLGARIISAIALQTHHNGYYVTSYKVNTSMDCVKFIAISDETGNAKIFDGNSDTEAFVIRDLPEGVRANCVRINPVTWYENIGLRFDVRGC